MHAERKDSAHCLALPIAAAADPETVLGGAAVSKGTVQGIDEIGGIHTRWKILGGVQAPDGSRIPVRDVLQALRSSTGTWEEQCELAAIQARIDGIMREIDAARFVPSAAALERNGSLVLCGGSAQVVALHAFSAAKGLVNAELQLCIISNGQQET
jgi:hypothetical protein